MAKGIEIAFVMNAILLKKRRKGITLKIMKVIYTNQHPFFLSDTTL